MDSQISRIANSIHRELSGSPAAPTGYSIFRVPRILRELNQKAYTPQMVSIGPLHHGKQDLILMEHHKKQYFKDLLSRAPLNLEICVRLVKQSEVKIRNCYGEESNLNSDQFVKMVLMDSAFIIESILKNSSPDEANGFSGYVQKDMVLIENQLPFFIIEEIYNQFDISTGRKCVPFLYLTTHYFSNFLLMKETTIQKKIEMIKSSEVKHFVDLLRMIHLPPSERTSTPHLSEKYVRVKNVTALHEAGMKFKVASEERQECPFVCEKGVLFLPHFSIQDSTQPALSNIIAMEHYIYPHFSYILDCVVFMDGLIDTARDVDILVQNDILQNWLGDNLAVANMFNKLTSEVFLASHKFYFYSLSDVLNKYCEVRRHKWKATLRRDYFSSPWRIASTIAAFILLFLTFVQAMCAVISL